MKAMAMVAHPDDCVIFAYSYMHHHPEYKWTVCYLTYTEDHARALEFKKFWQKRQVAVKFLGYPDQWNQLQNCPGDIDATTATESIKQAMSDQDLILTHNHEGEYGHPHHILVNQATASHPHRITFAGPGQGTIKYTLSKDVYSLDELPLHRDIIQGFHKDTHTNEYKL